MRRNQAQLGCLPTLVVVGLALYVGGRLVDDAGALLWVLLPAAAIAPVVLYRHDLRWTWALIPTVALSLLAFNMVGSALWAGLVAAAGLLVSKQVYDWQRRDVLAGGSLRKRARAQVGLPAARVDLRSYDHDHACGAVLIALEREFGAAAVVTERELRAHDVRRAEADYSVRSPHAAGARRPLRPPLPRLRDHGRRAPARDRGRADEQGRGAPSGIVRGYVGARHLAGVRYYAAGRTAQAIARAVRATEANAVRELVQLVELPVVSDRARAMSA